MEVAYHRTLTPGCSPTRRSGAPPFRRALSISRGDLTVFVTRPISLTLLLLALLALVLPYIPALIARLRGRRGEGRLVFGEGADD